MRYRSDLRRGIGRADFIATLLVLAVAVFVFWVVFIRVPYKGHQNAQCKNNLSQLGKAILMYEASEQGALTPDHWENQILPFVEDEEYVFQCPGREDGIRFGGEYSYALHSKSVQFTESDLEKSVLIESDHRLIEIDNLDCIKATVRGRPVSRNHALVNVLLHSAAVRTYELHDVVPDRVETLREFWLPAAENGEVCGPITIID